MHGFDPQQTKDFLRLMCLIRAAENQLAKMKEGKQIGGPVHLGVGQEAIAVGVSNSLKPEDRIFGAHRSHSHILALNPNLHKLFAEVLGRVTGFSKGMGGSMHLWDSSCGFFGSVPIVSGTVPLAVGAALASKLQENETVAISYLGDGAMEEGVVHECLNLASVYQLPVVFVVENNLFASHLHISQRQPKNLTYRFAEANNINFSVVDGNDVAAVSCAARNAIYQARYNNTPHFIEAITFRWYGHVDWREDIDVGVSRSAEEVKAWRSRDPIRRLEEAMITLGYWSSEDSQQMREALAKDIDEAWRKAMLDPFPEVSLLKSAVYKHCREALNDRV